MASKGFFNGPAYKTITKYAYGLGAAVVILGALFKINHWPFATEMLIAGMGTEVVIFALSALEPLPHEYHWEHVYPQLAEGAVIEDDFGFETESNKEGDKSGLEKLNKLEIKAEWFEGLEGSLKGLTDNVSKLSSIEDATVATNDYTSNVRNAASNLSKLNTGYSTTLESMSALANTVGDAATNAKAYQEQVVLATRNLASLNAVYELELNDAQTHVKSLRDFYGSLANAMNNMSAAAVDTDKYKQEVAALTKNIQTLNSVYGGMISAMRG